MPPRTAFLVFKMFLLLLSPPPQSNLGDENAWHLHFSAVQRKEPRDCLDLPPHQVFPDYQILSLMVSKQHCPVGSVHLTELTAHVLSCSYMLFLKTNFSEEESKQYRQAPSLSI
jgi:hypothetical protein